MNLTKKGVISAYDYIKEQAVTYSNQNDIEQSLLHIETCAKIAYYSNFFYTDSVLEKNLSNNADKITTFRNIVPIKGRYAFIDTDGSDNHGLTQQYIRGLIAAEVEFVYIYEHIDLSRIKIIMEELKAYPKATVYTFDRVYSRVEKTQMILELLSNYKPEKYIMHIMPWDVVAVMVCFLLKGVTRYNINATDHAFWLGASCIDYCIEFRDYGYTVSKEKRGLSTEQLILLPYYPIVNKKPFNGFPALLPKKCVKIFSGGAYYKTYGENGFYFQILKHLLLENPEAVILYAGAGDGSAMEKFITSNGLKNRVFLIGNRKDINQVFEACDIYLATYPITGALMAQNAAISGKPILSYSDVKLPVNFLEGIVCHQNKLNITNTNLESFYKHAKKLCSSAEFRVSEGDKLKKCVIPAHDFNEELKYLLLNNKSKRVLNLEKIDYDGFAQVYLDVENYFHSSYQKIIALTIRFKTLWKFPKIALNVTLLLIKDFAGKKNN